MIRTQTCDFDTTVFLFVGFFLPTLIWALSLRIGLFGPMWSGGGGSVFIFIYRSVLDICIAV